jgi:transcriptional regulator with GAF, ATPase, and Fis domain
MSGGLTQTTANQSDEGLAGDHDGAISVIRWVFPFPPRAPLWFDRASMTLGRDAEADVELPGSWVSRRHVQITRSGPLWLASDLDSKNGIFVNAKRTKAAVLTAGDVIRVGEHVGVYLQAPRTADLSFGTVGPGIQGGFAHRAAIARAKEFAASDLPVVLEGETGTGKELLAEALHEWSGRSGCFLAVNCAVYSKAVAAAELFGHRKGAFKGAEQASIGHIRAAQGGTLLLDELLELPQEVQAMLLRVIEHGEVLALGETRASPIDVRFVAASQVSLAQAVEQGRFRGDLQARLEGGVIRLPSLRHCKEIVPELFCSLYQLSSGRAPKPSVAFVERLCLYDWPFNIRELNLLARRLALSLPDGDRMELCLLKGLGTPASKPPSVPPEAGPTARRKNIAAPGRRPQEQAYDESEMRVLVATLSECGGNVTKAAQQMGLSRPKAYRILRAATRAGLVT